MTFQMKSGLSALAFSVACWTLIIGGAVKLAGHDAADIDPVVTANLDRI